MARLRVTLLTHHFPPRYHAGAEQIALRHARLLHQRGHHVEVVTVESVTQGTPQPACATDHAFGFATHRLSCDLMHVDDPFGCSYRNPYLDAWAHDFLARTRPDVVHVNSGYLLSGSVLEAALDLRLPTVLMLNDYWFLCPRTTLLRHSGRVCDAPVDELTCVWCERSALRRYRVPDRLSAGRLGEAVVQLQRLRVLPLPRASAALLGQMRDRRAYLRGLVERVDAVLVPSRFLMHKLAQYGLSPRRVLHLPTGLEPPAPGLEDETPRADATLRLGYLGQIAPHKGVHVLLDAFAAMRRAGCDVTLAIHGKLNDADAYHRRIRRRAARTPGVTLAGPYDNAAVGGVLRGLDAVVVPSVWYENYPVVILEALAHGVPVVASDLGGMAELVEHERNGLRFAMGDAGALARQLQRLADDRALLRQLRRHARRVNDAEAELDALEACYRAVVPA